MEGTIGVLGGMGPEATARFFDLLVRLTPAEKDQDHLRIMVVNDPKIPDRTSYLRRGGDSPLPALLSAVRQLEGLGCDLIAIPCNTAHAFWAEVSQAAQVPVLNIIEETVKRVQGLLKVEKAGNPPPGVGILATEGTVCSGLYQGALQRQGFLPQEPGSEMQTAITQSIEWIKANQRRDEARKLLEGVIGKFQEEGAKAVILGCTELGLPNPRGEVPVLDSLVILAEATLSRARSLPDE